MFKTIFLLYTHMQPRMYIYLYKQNNLYKYLKIVTIIIWSAFRSFVLESKLMLVNVEIT